MKDQVNKYRYAREKAAEYNDRLKSREGAAEILNCHPNTIAKYELLNNIVPAESVVLMADAYNAPELLTTYCMDDCPIHGFMRMATQEKDVRGSTLRILRNINELMAMTPTLVEIMEDGAVDEKESSDFEKIMEKLETVVETVSELKIFQQKHIKD